MRTLALVLATAALVGCNPQLATPTRESTAAFGHHPDADHSCLFVGPGEMPLADLWAGQKGYVVFHRLTTFCDPKDQEHYGVVGLDTTMRKVVFVTEVADLAGVQYYQHLPGTLPYTCHFDIDAGQVGSQNTDTGGGHWCPDPPCPGACEDNACFDNAVLDTLRISCTPCQPLSRADACGANSCGLADNGCGGVLSCGTCARGTVCQSGSCVDSGCVAHHCPKGSFFNPDSCGCEPGLPQ